MKKMLAILLAAVMCLSLAACGSKPAETQSAETTAVAGDETTAAAEEPTGKIDISALSAEEKEAARAEIRSALGLLFDRNYIVEQISQAGEVPASSFVAMGMKNPDGTEFYQTTGYSTEFDGYYNVAADAYESNFEKACTILEKYYDYDETTGKFTNFPTLSYLYNTSDTHKSIGEYLQACLASVGITMNMENQEWATFLNTRKDGNFSVARNGWVADFSDPICFLDMWTTDSGNNDIQFGRGDHAALKMYDLDLTALGIDIKVEDGTWAETYDVLLKEIKANTDPETRYTMMHIAEDMLMSTGTINPLYFYTDLYMLDDAVEGFYSNPLGFKYFQSTTLEGSDTLSVCLASEPDTLDPALNSSVDGATMMVQLFSGLTKWAYDDSGKLVIVADSAEELPEGVVNDDGTVTYTYTLKDNKWSDGKPVTAQDFEFAWKRAASEELSADYGYMLEIIKGYEDGDLAVKALDEKTLEVTINNLCPYWNELLAFPTYFPVREDVVANEAWATDPSTFVCNGPYKMTGWEHNSVITLTKNEGFVNAAEVTMPNLKCFLSDDQNNMLSNFKNGEWQLIDEVPVNEIPTLKAEYPEEFIVAGQIGTYYVCWNVNFDLLPQE